MLPAVARSLGVPDAAGRDGELLELAPSRSAVVVLVDGLGYDLLRQRSGHAPFLRSLLPAARRLAAGFPSTTATSMGTFGTGLPPGAHGLVGYEVLVPARTGCSTSCPGRTAPTPARWQPQPTVFEQAAAATGWPSPGSGPASSTGRG